jgi:TetR/AcrR family transcriptional regulator
VAEQVRSTESRDSILDAAEARFAGQGFAPTTIKQIAADASVNSALIYYYFADKEALYREVVTRLIARMGERMSAALAGAPNPTAAITAFATNHHAMLESEPHLRKLIGRELIDHDAKHAQGAIRKLAADTFERLRRAIEAGQQAGIFRRDLNARFVAISLVSQTTYFHLARPAISLIVADGGPVPEVTGVAFAQHAARFTLAALAPLPTSGATP